MSGMPRFAMTAQYDFAILDINLKGVYVDPVADLIERRGKPFLFATGYGPELLPSLLRRRPILRKPISIDQLKVDDQLDVSGSGSEAPLNGHTEFTRNRNEMAARQGRPFRDGMRRGLTSGRH